MTAGPPGAEPTGSDWVEWFRKLSGEIAAVRDLVERLLGEETHEAPSMEDLELKLKSVLAAQIRRRKVLGQVTRVAQTTSVKQQIDEAAAQIIRKRGPVETQLEKRAKASVAPKRAREGR